MPEPGALVLEDGRIFGGWLFGAQPATEAAGPGAGEVVFNTCMTGYQEILTDPSYAGQVVVMTYPMIGNYGVNAGDAESGRAWVRGLVVRQPAQDWSNWRAEGGLDAYLQEQPRCPGLAAVDTRSLTRHLRSAPARGGL